MYKYILWHGLRYLDLIIPILCVLPACDWSKPPSVNRQRHMRGRRLNDDVVMRRLFTLHYCTIVAVSATSETARSSRYRYKLLAIVARGSILLRSHLMSARKRLSGSTTQTDGQASNFVKAAATGVFP